MGMYILFDCQPDTERMGSLTVFKSSEALSQSARTCEKINNGEMVPQFFSILFES